MKTYYEFPQPFKTFLWVMLCLLNILVVFSACYTSAKSVPGFSLSVTAFVLILMTYAHEKRWRDLFSWPLIAYAFYSILVHGFLAFQLVADREAVAAYGAAYPVVLFGTTAIPYIFGAVAAVTTAAIGFVIHKKKIPVIRVLRASFAASLFILVVSTFFRF